MDNGNYDNVSRPRSNTTSGHVDSATFNATANSVEYLENLYKQIHETKIPANAKQIEQFVSMLYSKQTSSNELSIAIDILYDLFSNIEYLNEQVLSILLPLPSTIANHTNSNVKIIDTAAKLMTFIAGLLPSLKENHLYEKYFGNIATFGRYGKGFEWKIGLLDEYANNADDGINTIENTKGNALIGYVGILAEQHVKFSEAEMKTFQKSAVMLMNKTKFPYKFDKDAFREAIGLIPETKREQEYAAIFNKLNEFDEDKDKIDTENIDL